MKAKEEDKKEEVVQGATEQQSTDTQSNTTQQTQEVAATNAQPASTVTTQSLSEKAEEAQAATPPLTARQLRLKREAEEAQNSYNLLREHYDNPSDSQIDAALGKNTYAFQRQYNKGANWGTALGAGALFGKVNANTRKILEENYQKRLAAKRQEEAALSERGRVLAVLKDNDGNDVNVTQGLKHDMELWGQSVSDINNLTPQEVATFKQILRRNGVLNDGATTTATTATDGAATATGESAAAGAGKTDEQAETTQSLVSLMNGLPNADMVDDIFDVVGFYGEDGGLQIPHKETYEEMIQRRQLEKEKLDYQTQQRELQRKHARLGLADLAAGFGDMIKASNGAVVSKREFDNMYNQLTEQQKKNFDTYMARMQKLKDDAKEAAKEEKAYETREKERKEDKDFQKEMGDKEYEQKLNLVTLQGAIDAANAAKKYGASVSAEAIKQEAKNGHISYGGKRYKIREADQVPLYNALFGIMKEEIVKDKDLWGAFTSLDKAGSTIDKQQAVTSLALAVLNNPTIQTSLSAAKKRLINDTLQTYASGIEDIGGTSTEDIEAAADVYYNIETKQPISAADYNNLPEIEKAKYSRTKPNTSAVNGQGGGNTSNDNTIPGLEQ